MSDQERLAAERKSVRSGASEQALDCAIVTFYFPPCLGGLEYYLERLAAAMSERVSVAVLAPKLEDADATDRALPFPVVRRPMLGGIIFKRERLFKPLYPITCMLVFFWTLVSFWNRRPRVVCAGSADFAWSAGLAARLMGCEFTFICHGKDGHVNPGLFSYLFKRVPLAISMKLARVCFANSEFTRGLMAGNGHDGQHRDGGRGEKIKILRVPIDKGNGHAPSETAINAARATVGLIGSANEKHGPLIVSVGRLRRHKGFQHVIEAMPALLREFPDARYVIVGSGPFEDELREAARRCGVERAVVFAGPHRPPDAFLALADVFVTVTWDVADEPEGFGMVFIEAACFGVPSVAGNIGGMPEAVLDGKTGFCVPGANPAAIADAIGKLLRDRALRDRMGAAAREYAREFEPRRIAAQFIDTFQLEAGR